MLKTIGNEKERIIGAIMLIVAGVIIRILLENIMMDLFFAIAVIAILSGLLLGGYYTFIVPISVMLISDLYLGNTWILLFVWSGFLAIGIIGYLLKRKNCLTIKKAHTAIFAGIGGVLLYDLWTNFGCWLGWYPHTLNGLTACYAVAVPFTLWHLLSTTAALTALIIPLAYLRDHKILKTDFTIHPIERRTTLVIPAVIMVLAIVMIVF